MPAVTKRAPAPVAVDEGVNFGSLDFYVAGGGLPEGDYLWKNVQVQMYQAKNRTTQQPVGQARLGVMITLQSLTDPKATETEQFYSLGGNADKSFVPSEDGLRILTRPGGVASKFNDSTNWAVLLRHMYDAGLPQGVFTNSVEPLIGLKAHMANVPEPESRKGFQPATATGEAGLDPNLAPARQGNGQIAVVMSFLDKGMPWEADYEEVAAAPEPAAKVNGKAAAPRASVSRPAAAKAAPAPEPEPDENVDEDDMHLQTVNAIAEVLGKNENGGPKVIIRTKVHKVLVDTVGEDVAKQITNKYFMKDDTFNAVLGELGYAIAGSQVKPAA